MPRVQQVRRPRKLTSPHTMITTFPAAFSGSISSTVASRRGGAGHSGRERSICQPLSACATSACALGLIKAAGPGGEARASRLRRHGRGSLMDWDAIRCGCFVLERSDSSARAIRRGCIRYLGQELGTPPSYAEDTSTHAKNRQKGPQETTGHSHNDRNTRAPN